MSFTTSIQSPSFIVKWWMGCFSEPLNYIFFMNSHLQVSVEWDNVRCTRESEWMHGYFSSALIRLWGCHPNVPPNIKRLIHRRNSEGPGSGRPCPEARNRRRSGEHTHTHSERVPDSWNARERLPAPAKVVHMDRAHCRMVHASSVSAHKPMTHWMELAPLTDRSVTATQI